MSNYESIPRLLRAIGNAEDARKAGQQMLFAVAADMIDDSAAIIKLLEDVPGDTAVDKVRRLKEWYLELQKVARGQA